MGTLWRCFESEVVQLTFYALQNCRSTREYFVSSVSIPPRQTATSEKDIELVNSYFPIPIIIEAGLLALFVNDYSLLRCLATEHEK